MHCTLPGHRITDYQLLLYPCLPIVTFEVFSIWCHPFLGPLQEEGIYFWFRFVAVCSRFSVPGFHGFRADLYQRRAERFEAFGHFFLGQARICLHVFSEDASVLKFVDAYQWVVFQGEFRPDFGLSLLQCLYRWLLYCQWAPFLFFLFALLTVVKAIIVRWPFLTPVQLRWIDPRRFEVRPIPDVRGLWFCEEGSCCDKTRYWGKILFTFPHSFPLALE